MTDREILRTTESTQKLVGRRAHVVVDHHDILEMGLRTVTTTWLEPVTIRSEGVSYPAGTIERKVVEGDGRLPDFIVHEHNVIVPPSPATDDEGTILED